MSENKQNIDILFVNGVNTAFGGSVAESNKAWMASFRDSGVRTEILDTVPSFKKKSKNIWYFTLLSIYFLPGTIFRLLKAPIFEFFLKICPALIIRFIINILTKRPRRVIFSHHSAFLLALLCPPSKRIFLIHDLMYVRGRSKGASRRAQRFYFYIEINIYKLAPTILIQSYHEWRVLRKFIGNNVHLISCCNLNLDTTQIEKYSSIAVISDWRRPENKNGAVVFFSKPSTKYNNDKKIKFYFFGFNSTSIVSELNSLPSAVAFNILDGGVYNKLSDINDGYFFIPIYHGAGIKRKTLEAICAGRVAVGTKGAFIGLPPWAISKVVVRVNSLHDLQSLPDFPDQQEFYKTLKTLSKHFNSIGNINELIN